MKKRKMHKELWMDFIHLQIFPWPSFLCKLRVHTIAEKHNHYLTVCTMAQIPKQDHICRLNFFSCSIFLIWTSNSWLHHVMYEKLQKTQVQVECTKHCDINFEVNIMGVVLHHQKWLRSCNIYCAIRRYIDFCDRLNIWMFKNTKVWGQ